MTVLVDTGFVYADHDTDAPRHEAASSALQTVYDGQLGQAYVSESVYDEAVTLTLRRSNSVDAATRLGHRLRGVEQFPDVYELLYPSPRVFSEAIEIFERSDGPQLSITAAAPVPQYRNRAIDTLLRFDDDFDGVVDRRDPRDL